jgi:hypothetical protein
MHSLLTPEKRGGHHVRRASILFGRTRAPHPPVLSVRSLRMFPVYLTLTIRHAPRLPRSCSLQKLARAAQTVVR